MGYHFKHIEKKWKEEWRRKNIFKVTEDKTKPKFYVLDMFPYPSGSGLHVGHPLGYIASDIFSRYKKLQGFNVLHPMGFDSFGLPTEQYAIKTGQHPIQTTEKNIATFKKQLENIGFNYDWSREVRTSNPKYYKWTQWIFLQLYHSWFDREEQKAKPIKELEDFFSKYGSKNKGWMLSENQHFSSNDWNEKRPLEKQQILMQYRLAFLSETFINWCEELGTVLANDEVINGKSERGNHAVEKKKMTQWFLRITEYAERLLEGLEEIDFSEAMTEMQKNWIGKSIGVEIDFPIQDLKENIKVFTTRPETLFGVDFMVIAPEHELVDALTIEEHKKEVEDYLNQAKQKSDVERMTEVKKVSGVFTGSYCVRPFDNHKIPIWISNYVLIGYGTGAIMAVPCGDQRDCNFATHFQIPITNICGDFFDGVKAYSGKKAKLTNSHFLTGLGYEDSLNKIIVELEKSGQGNKKINYKMRDAGFSRQRYWGEPFPVCYDKDGVIKTCSEDNLPLVLPDANDFKPTGSGKGPLSKIDSWINLPEGMKREADTMPGYAGSSWYFLRYMDPHNDDEFCSKEKSEYWGQVDVYLGGTEHAVGHLLYSRMWNNLLYDLGYVKYKEPYKKLINQGMVTGNSRLAYYDTEKKIFVSHELVGQYDKLKSLYVNVSLVSGYDLDIEEFKQANPNFKDYDFIMKGKKFVCDGVVEKMSKRKLNTINPDDIISEYGADCFRMYEMFLGPLELSKPWNTKGIEGVSRFLNKFWRLFHHEQDEEKWMVEDAEPTKEERKILHSTLKKVETDMEKFSFNTIVSTFMIATNQLQDVKCKKRQILEPLLVAISPFAPFIAEELWHKLGNKGNIYAQGWMPYDEKYLIEDTTQYPVSVNGKVRAQIVLSADINQQEAEEKVLQLESIKKWLNGAPPKKIIFVKGRMINVVV